MSLSGNLEDVSVADALQFIHLGGRTGTLTLSSLGREASIGFHTGRIVSAWGPEAKRLGDLLVHDGAITEAQLADALRRQEAEQPRRSLGQILVAADAISAEVMYRAVEHQIERTVYDLVTWTQGTFQFAMDELTPVDDISVFPGDILKQLNLDTQMVLLDALRIFDERNRDAPLLSGAGLHTRAASPTAPISTIGPQEITPPAARPPLPRNLPPLAPPLPSHAPHKEPITDRMPVPPPPPRPAGLPTPAEGQARVPLQGAPSPPPAPAPTPVPPRGPPGESDERIAAPAELSSLSAQPPEQATSAHELIAASARAGLLHTGRIIVPQGGAGHAPLETGGRPRLQVVSADRQLPEKLAHLLAEEAMVSRQTLREAGGQQENEAPPLVLLDLRGGGMAFEAIEALHRSRPRAVLLAVVDGGAQLSRVYETGVVTAVPGDLGVVIAAFRSLVRARIDLAVGPARTERLSANFAKLRRIVGDLRSGLISTTISLSLMNIISESVERAVLFLVRRDALVALGAFGTTHAGVPLAQLTRGLRLPLTGAHALTAGLTDGQVRSVNFDAAAFPDTFAQLLGRPRSGQCAIFPVLGGQRVVAMVYADNGPSTRQIEEIEILELAAAQAGLAFENELLRRQANH